MIIIDAHSLLWRMFYTSPMLSSAGIAEVAAERFVRHARQVAMYFGTDLRCCVAWEGPGENWRKSILPQYKGQRRASQADKENAACVERTSKFIRDGGLLDAEGGRFEHWTIDGGEGDDTIAWLATHSDGAAVVIYTKDRDMLQLVSSSLAIRVCLVVKTNPFDAVPADCRFGRVYSTHDQVLDLIGVRPHQMADFKALAGDAGDNIPGIKGVGAKTATRLLSTYYSLDGVIDACREGKEKGKLAERIANEAALAYDCRTVARLPAPRSHFSSEARRLR